MKSDLRHPLTNTFHGLPAEAPFNITFTPLRECIYTSIGQYNSILLDNSKIIYGYEGFGYDTV